MERKYLEELGLDKEQIDKVMAEHGKGIQAAKPKEDIEQLKAENQSLNQQIIDLNNSLSGLNEEKTKFEQTNSELESKISGYERQNLQTRIAYEYKLPFDLASRLHGETEDELKADAESLAKFINLNPVMPLKPTEPESKQDSLYSNQARIIAEQYNKE